MAKTAGEDLAKILWLKSETSEVRVAAGVAGGVAGTGAVVLDVALGVAVVLLWLLKMFYIPCCFCRLFCSPFYCIISCSFSP